jgi:stress-induced morphogen
MIEPDEIQNRILSVLPGAAVDVRDMTGTADHYEVEVIAGQFAGLNSIERHRLVYAAVSDVIGGRLHALSLKTLAPGE